MAWSISAVATMFCTAKFLVNASERAKSKARRNCSQPNSVIFYLPRCNNCSALDSSSTGHTLRGQQRHYRAFLGLLLKRAPILRRNACEAFAAAYRARKGRTSGPNPITSAIAIRKTVSSKRWGAQSYPASVLLEYSLAIKVAGEGNERGAHAKEGFSPMLSTTATNFRAASLAASMPVAPVTTSLPDWNRRPVAWGSRILITCERSSDGSERFKAHQRAAGCSEGNACQPPESGEGKCAYDSYHPTRLAIGSRMAVESPKVKADYFGGRSVETDPNGLWVERDRAEARKRQGRVTPKELLRAVAKSGIPC